MNKVKFLLFALVAVVAAACTTDPSVDGVESLEGAVAKKIVNRPTAACPGSMLIYVDEQTADALQASLGNSRTGIASLDEVAAQIDVTSIDYVTPGSKFSDEERAFGLHRWFEVRFSEDVNVEEVALKLASLGEVKRVEYNTLIESPKSKAHVVDINDIIATRASQSYFDDAMYGLQWHYRNTGNKAIFPDAMEGADINVEPAWDYTTGHRDVIVAIIDEGVDYRHPDLKDNVWVNQAEFDGAEGVDDDGNGYVDDIYGWNFVPGTNGKLTWDEKAVTGDPEDDDVGHGTHVAGTIAAVNNNGIGVVGVAGGNGTGNGVRVMSCQIFSAGRTTTIATNGDAIRYAANMGACILQCSWGYPGDYNPTSDEQYERERGYQQEAIRYFMSKNNCAALNGGAVIFAAGNDTLNTASYPGAFNEYISVSAYGPNGLPTTYTNYGPGVNIAAPGGDYYPNYSTMEWEESGLVLSTLPNEAYGYMPGTSMACPHVSGVAALVLSHALELGKTLTLDQLYSILLTSVNDIDSRLTGKYDTVFGTMNLGSYKGKMGTGMIDAFQAVMAVRGTLCVPATVGKECCLDLKQLRGDGTLSLKLLKEVEISDEVESRLGIKDVAVFGNKVYFTCEKAGSGTVTIHAVAGGDTVGGGATMGGMDISIDVAVVSRMANNSNGWL